jgi:hypothetical protein
MKLSVYRIFATMIDWWHNFGRWCDKYLVANKEFQ